MLATPSRPARLGHYGVVGRLGEGGMGVVFDAIDLDNGLHLALKVLQRLDAEAVRRLKFEYRAVVDVVHRNLVRLYGLEQHEGLLCLTMERIDGPDWLSWVRDDEWAAPSSDTIRSQDYPSLVGDIGPDELEYTSRIREPASAPRHPERLRGGLVQLLRGLHELHQAGHVHLDLKPSNILVEEEAERVVILDMGMAMAAGPGSLTTHLFGGTLQYMAPEQAAGDDVGPPTDLYAVGVLLFESLTGTLPFPDSHPVQLLAAKAKGPRQRPSELVPGTDPVLDQLTVDLLSPIPGARPTITDVLRRLGNDARLLPVPATFVGRQDELALLHDALLHADSPRLVELRGPGGHGKSTLLRRFLTEVRERRGALYFRGRCYEHENLPHKGFDMVVDRLATYLRRVPKDRLKEWVATIPTTELLQVFPTLRRVGVLARTSGGAPATGAKLRSNAYDALAQLLARLAERWPLLIAIDDLQWADRDTLDLLKHLLHADIGRCLFVTTDKGQEVHDDLAPPGAHRSVHLGPLPGSDAAELARQLLNDLDADVDLADAIASDAGGVPWFTIALCRARAAGGDQAWTDMGDLLRSQATNLSPGARDLLDAVALFEHPVPLHHASDAARIPQAPHGLALELVAAKLVDTVGSLRQRDVRLAPSHDLVRRAVLQGLDATRRLDLHSAYFRSLVPNDGDLPTMLFAAVRHAVAGRSALRPEERVRAGRFALEAAERSLEQGAFELAGRYAEDVVTLLGDDSKDAAWHVDPHLVVDATLVAAEAAHLHFDHDAEQGLDDWVLAHAEDPIDRAPAVERRILRALDNEDYAEAVELALGMCEELGRPLERSTAEELPRRLDHACRNARRLTLELGRERCEDAHVTWAHRLISRVYDASYGVDPVLSFDISAFLVNDSVQVGLTESTAFGLAALGVLLSSVGRVRDGVDASRLADQLLETDDTDDDPHARLIIHGRLRPWESPASAVRDRLGPIWRDALRQGDGHVADSTAVTAAALLFFFGDTPLETQLEKVEKHANAMQRAHRDGSLRQWIRLLRSLQGSRSTELHLLRQRSVRQVRFTAALANAIEAAHLGSAEQALATARAWSEPFHDVMAGTWWSTWETLLMALGHLRAHEDGLEVDAVGCLRASVGRFERWTEECPTFTHGRHQWLLAELARLEGRDAEPHVEAALADARAQGAWLCEGWLLARFGRSLEARERYRALGANALVDALS